MPLCVTVSVAGRVGVRSTCRESLPGSIHDAAVTLDSGQSVTVESWSSSGESLTLYGSKSGNADSGSSEWPRSDWPLEDAVNILPANRSAACPPLRPITTPGTPLALWGPPSLLFFSFFFSFSSFFFLFFFSPSTPHSSLTSKRRFCLFVYFLCSFFLLITYPYFRYRQEFKCQNGFR